MSSTRSASQLGLLLRHELRSILRDRKTVLLSVLLPLLIMPLLLVAVRWTGERKQAADEARSYHYVVAGDDADWLAAQVAAGGAARAERAKLEPDARPPAKLERDADVPDPAQALESEAIHAWLGTTRDDEGVRVVEVHFRGNRDSSQTAAKALSRALEAARAEQRQVLLDEQGVGIQIDQLAPLERHDVADPGASAGLKLGKFLTFVLIMLLLPGGQIVAADIMAGEKERGTLETLITTAASRREIVASKLLTIASVALGITAINVLNLLVYVSFGLLPGAETLAGSLTPLAVIVLGIGLIPVALLVSSLLLLLSSYARSFKEAQLFGAPLQLLVMVPALAAVLPGLELRSAILVVPIANLSVATRDILSGHFDWLALAALVIVNTGFAAWTARHVARALDEEKIIAPAAAESTEVQRGPAAFRQHVLRWVAALWAILLIASVNWAPDLRVQLLFNLVLLMLGASIVMVRVYGLDVREAWALRKPPPIAWLAVLIGAPAGLIVAQGAFELSSLVLPVPAAALESFSEALSPEIPAWQLYLMLTLLPGVCEEILFRGMLLHGLRKQLGPVALCVVVGLVFGLFHVALFRLIPTGLIGIMLAAVTLLSGSIFPAMLWHALNNLLGVMAGELGLAATDTPMWLYAVASVVLGLAFALLWRFRSVYPDLRGAPAQAGSGSRS